MMNLSHYPISQQHIERWSQLLVAETAPFFVSEELRPLLPAEIPLFSRSAIGALRLDLAVHDSYILYAVPHTYQHVVFLRHADLLGLPPALRERLLHTQWQAGRGQVYTWEQVSDYFTSAALQAQAQRCLVDTERGRKLVLDCALWRRLPGAAREQWLKDFVARNGHPYPTLPPGPLAALQPGTSALPSLANTFALSSGPNCLSTVLAAVTGSPSLAQTIGSLWLHQDMFLEGLAVRGYSLNPAVSAGDQGLADAVYLWNDAQGIPQHACWAIGAGLALNKNSQAWYAPRHIAAIDDIIGYWEEDNLQLEIHTRPD